MFLTNKITASVTLTDQISESVRMTNKINRSVKLNSGYLLSIWILATRLWNDLGIWKDESEWID